VVQKAVIVLLVAAVATAAVGQESDTDRRIKELERQIDIITRELESIKNAQKPAAAAADTAQYGLGAAASKVYRSETGVSLGGYGEFTYRQGKHDPATADLLRAVLYTGYKFNPRVLFNSELEVEHASTEAAGAVSVEFAYLDFLNRPELNVRAGQVLVPMGLVNEQHEPTAYLGARRPLPERFVIASTWSEVGGGVFGDAGIVCYRGYVMTALEWSMFNDQEGIREGRQGGSEASASRLAVVARADWHPYEGTMFGGSAYRGGDVTLAEVHADTRFRGVTLRALVARGHSDAVSPLAKSFNGWYVEGGYDVSSHVTPYARYEGLNLRQSKNLFTVGLAFRPISQTVIKVDWQNDKHVNALLGYIF
jgi:hypothetical protein